MKTYCSSNKITAGALVCLFFIFSMALKGEAANVFNVSASPNPFNPDRENTTISYYLNNSAVLWLRIYDSSGVLTRKLVVPDNNYTENKTSDSNSDEWDARDDMGGIVQNGAYPYYIDDIAYISASSTGQSPYDLVVDPSLNLWMTASDNNLYKSTDGGSSWSQVIYGGSGPAYGIAISNDGQKIYVLDNGEKSLYYSTNGGSSWSNYSLWRSMKHSQSQPRDIACNSDGIILYGVDQATNKVYKSTNSGAGWNSGTAPPGANTLTGIAIDPSDLDSNTILVADVGSPGATRVYKSTDGGSSFTTILSSVGTGDGEFNSGNGPYQISFDTNGNYWVSDRGNHRVQEFDSNNNWVMTVGGASPGTGDYQFDFNNVSSGVFATSFSGQQYLYVADYNNKEIKKYAYDNYAPVTDIIASTDTAPPAAITDLATTGTVGSNSVELTWTAPGDDGNDLYTQAASYDVRYAKTAITTDAEFSAATQATGEPIPSVQGTTECFTVTGLESNTIYYFAVKSLDEETNTSGLSTSSPIGKTGLLSGDNMVSCPLQPVPNDSSSVFEDDAGINWMSYWYSTWTGGGDPDSAGYWEKAGIIVPGKGIFLYSIRTNNPTDASGYEIIDESYTLSLSAGWNLIGNPYGTCVNLSSCDVFYNPLTETYADAVTAGWIGNAIYISNGSTYDSIQWDVAELEPWKGYWIFAYYKLDLIINKP